MSEQRTVRTRSGGQSRWKQERQLKKARNESGEKDRLITRVYHPIDHFDLSNSGAMGVARAHALRLVESVQADRAILVALA